MLGTVSFASNNDLASFINAFFHINLLTFEMLRRKLASHQRQLQILYDYLGQLDAAITVASFRKSLSVVCDPQIDFSPSGPSCLSIEGLVHPLLDGAVPNDICLQKALLITGSNASGKSTFLKSVAINAILAQSICTALGQRYTATPFCIYTSMAIADDVQKGESYFIAEIKSLKRVFDALDKGERVLCVIDEVLRGTNTVERVAASSELLRALATQRGLCLAATHDLELCTMLSRAYQQTHFEEQIVAGDIQFDFVLKDGPTTSKNAIALLDVMGFDPTSPGAPVKRRMPLKRPGNG